MTDDPLEGAVSRVELDEFDRRHPRFRAALQRLQGQLEEAFVRVQAPRPDKPEQLQSVIFWLGHQAAADFFDILLLAVHGYGFGAVKMLRPLFERVVTVLYLIKNPAEVDAFNKYADIDAWHLFNWALVSSIDPATFMTADEVAEARAAYERVKGDFTPRKKHRERGTWSGKDLAARADDVGLKQLYGPAALWPTLHIHTTRVGFEACLSRSAAGLTFTHGPKREQADYAIAYAHGLMVLLLRECNSFFGWNLDLTQIIEDVASCSSRSGNAA